MITPFGLPHIDPGYIAIDDFNHYVTDNVIVSGTVDTGMLGTYTLQYDVSDSSGNMAIIQNRTVIVADLTAPVMTLYGSTNMTIPYNFTYA